MWLKFIYDHIYGICVDYDFSGNGKERFKNLACLFNDRACYAPERVGGVYIV